MVIGYNVSIRRNDNSRTQPRRQVFWCFLSLASIISESFSEEKFKNILIHRSSRGRRIVLVVSYRNHGRNGRFRSFYEVVRRCSVQSCWYGVFPRSGEIRKIGVVLFFIKIVNCSKGRRPRKYSY